jgi:cleavage and polyadenylation specificity factor subunit 3
MVPIQSLIVVYLVTSHSHSHNHVHADSEDEGAGMQRIQRVAMFLEAHFGDVELYIPDDGVPDAEEGAEELGPTLAINLDDAEAVIHLETMVGRLHAICIHTAYSFVLQTVSSSDDNLRRRVEAVLDMASTTVTSLSDAFVANSAVHDDDDIALKKAPNISIARMEIATPA